jgi:serine/threonine protein kinase
MRELAKGLAQIHENVIHGDIHDGNILLMGDPETWDLHGDDPLVKYADFGSEDPEDPASFASVASGNAMKWPVLSTT